MEHGNKNLSKTPDQKTVRISRGLEMHLVSSSARADAMAVRLIGELSLETVHDFISTMRPEPALLLVLDLSGVSFLDSAGVGALVALFVSRRNSSRKLALVAPTQPCNAVLEVSGVADFLPLYASLDLAIRRLESVDGR
jgi:anti-anti-sigma factor